MPENIAHYFIRKIDVYQGNNTVKINIHARDSNIPTIKAAFNGIIAASVGNDSNGAKKLFLDHCYAYSKILAILEEEINLLAGGTCHNNWSRA